MSIVMSSPAITAPVFEHHHDGLGLGVARPRISWRFISDANTTKGWKQTAYELEIERDSAKSVTSVVVQGQDSTLVPWPCTEALQSREVATVRVRCFGVSVLSAPVEEVTVTDWSPPAQVEVGLLDKEDWTAHFIAPSKHIGPEAPLQPLRFYKQLDLSQEEFDTISTARLYISALGVFEAYINGQRTSNECMAPGWTSYNHRLSYRVHDVSTLLKPGQNTICVEVGEGWFAGQLGIQGGGRFLYGGNELGLLAQLEIRSQDGQFDSLVESDETWYVAASAIQTSEIYNGELYDARLENSEDWTTRIPEDVLTCRHLPWVKGRLVAPEAPPVRVVESVDPVDIIRSKSGHVILDFGQNLVGKLLIKHVQIPEGDSLTFKHAEVIEHGELGVRPLRSAKCTDTIISAGLPIQNWTPKFTYHGFRYVQVEGWPEARESSLLGGAISALVMQSDLKRRGRFRCSNKWLNKLHDNVVWSMRGNFFSIPTDCPQRAERLGWTGDANLFCPTASFLFDTVGMLSDWLKDLSAEQLEPSRNGIPPLVCPDVLWTSLFPQIPQAIWDDAAIMVPWSLFTYSGDLALLEQQFASMEAWLTQGLPRGPDGLWDTIWQFGDWLDPTAPPEDPSSSRADATLVADAFLVHVTETMAKICSLLSKQDYSMYREEAIRLKQAFQHKYISPHGNLMGSSQTGLALAIKFDLYQNESQVQVAATHLERLVRESRFHIATGFAGTPFITYALTQIGKPQLAYRMLLETTCPSWLYPITMGATTIWERWNSMLPDGSINPGVMTSFNHYALGAVADWMHSTIGGISALSPGWKKIQVRPVPGGNVTSATVSFESPSGLIFCSWTLNQNGHFSMDLVVPPNSEAVVTLPSSSAEGSSVVYSGTHHFTCQCRLGDWPPSKILPPFLPKPKEETIAV